MRLFIAAVLTCLSLFAARPQELAVLLEDPPVAVKFAAATTERNSFAAQAWRTQLRTKQAVLKKRLAELKIPVTGSADTFLNAVFVNASMDQVAQLRGLPGVSTVALAPRLHRTLDKALDLQKVKQAWNSVGGVTQAGAGVKIAIIDSGIDHTHPGLVDSLLQYPMTFPKGDIGFTTPKVIVARSYVSALSYPDVRYSSPDDNSPRDHVGHGTAVAMIAAGNTVKTPAAGIAGSSITGVAPKAFLGNYKIFGSPGVNEFTTTSVLVTALEDAYNDGMDIAILSLGSPAFGAPLDTSTSCQQTPLRPWVPATACDVSAVAVEHAVSVGMVVVVAAGNDGCSGLSCPTLGTINTPGTAPSAITVGSTTNSHVIFSQVRAGSQTWNGISGNGPRLNAPLTAPLVDVTKLGNDGNLCTAVTAGSLAGSLALVTRGVCSYFVKVDNAQAAGALGVIMYDTTSDNIFQPTFELNETALPLEYVGITAGSALKSASAAAGFQATLDPALSSLDSTAFDQIAFDSSRGPVIGNSALKPDIAAVGVNVYTAAQNLDSNGDSYDPSRFTSVNGTSFAAAMVGGAAALVKQAHPGYTALQIKSALVNTATTGVVLDSSTGAAARTTAVGGGKLDAFSAVTSNVTANPQVISFGQIAGKFPAAVPITVTNTGSASQTLSLAIAPRDHDGNATVTVSPSTLTLSAGQSQTVTVSMTGKVPTYGSYEGQLNINGGSAPLHLPYLYIVTDNTIANSYPLSGDYFFAAVTEYPDYIFMRLTDQFGAPIANAPIQWSALNSGAVDFRNSDSTTDAYGVTGATLQQSATPGFNLFQGISLGGWGWQFTEIVNYAPYISNGIFNAATQLSGGLAPGSYATISGSDFASVPILPNSICQPDIPCLPISLGEVSVSFDATGISVPAPISYMSFNQINIQIPWELAGQSSASVKVTYHGIVSPPVTLPLAPTSPAYFEYTDATNGQLSAVAQDLNYQLITSQNPAGRGKVITLYVNGLGPVDNTPATGALSSSTKLGRTLTTPVVTIGGVNAPVLFSGLTPQTIGLYQINVTIPAGAPTGVQPLTVSIGGVSGKTSQLTVN